MKWYSTKKYSPGVINNQFLIRNKYGVWLARYEASDFWRDENDAQFIDDAEPTHFALIKPVEIEE